MPSDPRDRDPRQPPRRLQTQEERDAQSLSARRERERARTPAREVPVVWVEPEVTGNYEGEALRQERAKRPTLDRIDRLEVKHDDMAKLVGPMAGQVQTILDFAAKADEARENRLKLDADERIALAKQEFEERERKRKYIVPIITALGVIIVGIIAALVARG